MPHGLLLISDVDHTMLGDPDGLDALRSWLRGAPVAIAYASGRQVDSIAADVGPSRLPSPVAIIGAVGTEVVRWPSGAPLDGWSAFRHRAGWSAAAVRRALEDESDLELQPASEQSAHKVSYTLVNADPARVAALEQRLVAHGLEAHVVYSSGDDLDVLPRGIHKGAAARFLAAALGYPDERVVVAGDSGNDVALFQEGFRGIAVGNAKAELLEAVPEGTFRAEGKAAAGVLEGLRHIRGED